MKNILLYIITSTVLLFGSCSSDNLTDDTVTPDTTLRKVTFSISGLASETSETLLKTASLDELNITYLEYWVYKTADLQKSFVTDAPILHSILKKEDFNKDIVLELPDNDYTILFYATDAAQAKASTSYIYLANAVDTKSQMFSAKKEFNINKQNPEIKGTIALNRIVGKVEIVIEDLDKLPADVQSITPFVTGFTPISVYPGMPCASTGFDVIRQLSWWGGGKNNFPTIPRSQFSSINKDNPIVIYTLPTECARYQSSLLPYEIYIQGTKDNNFYTLEMQRPLLEQNSKVSFMRRVGRYEVKANQVIRYTGKIGGVNDIGFNVSINENWDEINLGIDN